MKMYKGFNKDMTCRGFQFEEGKTYETEKAKLCNNGFHACERPLDVLGYYAPAGSEYHEVEMEDVSLEIGDDSKRVAKKISIGAKLSIRNLVDAQIQFVKEHCTNENNAKEGEPATAGDSGAATAGDSGAATAGFRGAATAGDSGAATAGSYGAATAGFRGAATAGSYGAATSKGSSAVGDNGLAVARGNNCKVKGGIGSILVVAEENEDNCDIKWWASAVVDGEKIKPDTWYCLKDGELVKAE